MDIEYFPTLGVSSWFGCPYYVSRLLFLFLGLFIVGVVGYLLVISPQHYAYFLVLFLVVNVLNVMFGSKNMFMMRFWLRTCVYSTLYYGWS